MGEPRIPYTSIERNGRKMVAISSFAIDLSKHDPEPKHVNALLTISWSSGWKLRLTDVPIVDGHAHFPAVDAPYPSKVRQPKRLKASLTVDHSEPVAHEYEIATPVTILGGNYRDMSVATLTDSVSRMTRATEARATTAKKRPAGENGGEPKDRAEKRRKPEELPASSALSLKPTISLYASKRPLSLFGIRTSGAASATVPAASQQTPAPAAAPKIMRCVVCGSETTGRYGSSCYKCMTIASDAKIEATRAACTAELEDATLAFNREREARADAEAAAKRSELYATLEDQARQKQLLTDLEAKKIIADTRAQIEKALKEHEENNKTAEQREAALTADEEELQGYAEENNYEEDADGPEECIVDADVERPEKAK
jgi:hypothetical protein